MILSHDDLPAIEASLGTEKAAPIISALEKLEREQKVEVKKDLILELATKADLAELKGALQMEIADLRKDFVRLETELKGENRRMETALNARITRLEMLMKVLIGLVVVAMGFFSPIGVELITLLK